MIIYGKSGESNRYFDKNGIEITEGCKVKYDDREIKTVYAWSDDHGRVGLGTDATNPKLVETGRAEPCEYGIYPFSVNELKRLEVMKED